MFLKLKKKIIFIIFIGFNLFNLINSVKLYVLELANNKYFVGKTFGLIKSKLLIHQIGESDEWTKIYTPKNIIEKIHLPNNFNKYEIDEKENDLVIKYMNLYGIDNVRGGKYNNVILNDFQIQNIKKKLNLYNK